jgi:hypothetical protein
MIRTKGSWDFIVKICEEISVELGDRLQDVIR